MSLVFLLQTKKLDKNIALIDLNHYATLDLKYNKKLFNQTLIL